MRASGENKVEERQEPGGRRGEPRPERCSASRAAPGRSQWPSALGAAQPLRGASGLQGPAPQPRAAALASAARPEPRAKGSKARRPAARCGAGRQASAPASCRAARWPPGKRLGRGKAEEAPRLGGASARQRGERGGGGARARGAARQAAASPRFAFRAALRFQVTFAQLSSALAAPRAPRCAARAQKSQARPWRASWPRRLRASKLELLKAAAALSGWQRRRRGLGGGQPSGAASLPRASSSLSARLAAFFFSQRRGPGLRCLSPAKIGRFFLSCKLQACEAASSGGACLSRSKAGRAFSEGPPEQARRAGKSASWSALRGGSFTSLRPCESWRRGR